MDTLEIVTVIASGLFAGASIYINLVEHPARLSCGTAIAVKQWAPSYKRATVMQVSRALVATVAGIGRVTRWRRAAVVSRCSANLRRHSFHPHRVLPTNNRLLAPGRDPASAETQRLLEKWGHLHAVRSGLSLMAFVLFVWAR